MAAKPTKTLNLSQLAEAVSSAAKTAAARRGVKINGDVHFRDGFIGVEIADGGATTKEVADFAADVVAKIKGPSAPLGTLSPAAMTIRLRTWAGGMWGPIPDSWLKYDIIFRIPG